MSTVETKVTILYADGSMASDVIEMEADPSVHDLRSFMAAIFQGADIEHVRVWQDGEYRSMFVDEIGQRKGLPHNANATAIYRANALAHVPGAVAEEMPDIVGTAVVFNRYVW